jgi:hypothetical protein
MKQAALKSTATTAAATPSNDAGSLNRWFGNLSAQTLPQASQPPPLPSGQRVLSLEELERNRLGIRHPTSPSPLPLPQKALSVADIEKQQFISSNRKN